MVSQAMWSGVTINEVCNPVWGILPQKNENNSSEIVFGSVIRNILSFPAVFLSGNILSDFSIRVYQSSNHLP